MDIRPNSGGYKEQPMKKTWKALLTVLLISALLAGCVPAAQAPQSRTTASPEPAAPELVLITPSPEKELSLIHI